MPNVDIIPLRQNHYDEWYALYAGYADHYQVPLTEKGVTQTWTWLHADTSPVTGIVASIDDVLVGLAHFRAMPSPLRGAEICFLDDLFVSPSARGARVGETLLHHVAKIAGENGWPVVRWITRDNNYRARTLYDRVAVKTNWAMYEMPAE